MASRRPIDTAPRDGRKVQVYWTDADGQENLSFAQYRSPAWLKQAGGDWDDSDAGWWAYVDGSTQKRITPTAWMSDPDEDQ
jgi:hypothetical protein